MLSGSEVQCPGLLKNNKPVIFQLPLKLSELQTTEKTIGLLFLKYIYRFKPFTKKSWNPEPILHLLAPSGHS